MMTFTGDDPHWPHWNPFSKSIVEHNNSRNPYQANLKCAYEKVFWNRRSFDLSWLSLRDKKGRDFEFKSSFDHMLPHCPQTPSLGSARRPSGILSRRGLEYCCFRSTSRSKGMPLLEKTLTQGHDDIFLEAFSGKSMFKVFAFSTKNDVCSHWGDLHVMHNIFSLYVTIPHDPWLVTQR